MYIKVKNFTINYTHIFQSQRMQQQKNDFLEPYNIGFMVKY